MPWANLDDQYAEHPNNWDLSDAAFRLHTAAICYANRHTTDGEIPVSKVRTLVPKFRGTALAELLRGHWVDKGDRYEIRDFLDWNRSRAQIESERERKSRAGRKGAQKRWQ
jgi:hypothetical protein